MNGPTVEAHHRRETRLNITISRCLWWSARCHLPARRRRCADLVHSGVPVPRKTSIQGIPRALRALEPGGFFQLGLLVLLATPAARVAALFLAYVDAANGSSQVSVSSVRDPGAERLFGVAT